MLNNGDEHHGSVKKQSPTKHTESQGERPVFPTRLQEGPDSEDLVDSCRVKPLKPGKSLLNKSRSMTFGGGSKVGSNYFPGEKLLLVEEIRLINQLRLVNISQLFNRVFSTIQTVGWPWDFWSINPVLYTFQIYHFLMEKIHRIFSKAGLTTSETSNLIHHLPCQVVLLCGWWLNQPVWQNMPSKLGSFAQVGINICVKKTWTTM